MVRRMLVVAVLMSILGFNNLWAAEKYACIDVEQVFNEYQMTKDEEDVLTKKGEEKQKEIDAKLKDIEKLKEQVDIVNDKDKEKKKAELDQKMEELRQFDRQVRADLMRKRNEVIKIILDEIDQVIADYGKSKGYTIIYNARALLYKDAKLDITSEILDSLNKVYSKRKK